MKSKNPKYSKLEFLNTCIYIAHLYITGTVMKWFLKHYSGIFLLSNLNLVRKWPKFPKISRKLPNELISQITLFFQNKVESLILSLTSVQFLFSASIPSWVQRFRSSWPLYFSATENHDWRCNIRIQLQRNKGKTVFARFQVCGCNLR